MFAMGGSTIVSCSIASLTSIVAAATISVANDKPSCWSSAAKYSSMDWTTISPCLLFMTASRNCSWAHRLPQDGSRQFAERAYVIEHLLGDLDISGDRQRIADAMMVVNTPQWPADAPEDALHPDVGDRDDLSEIV